MGSKGKMTTCQIICCTHLIQQQHIQIIRALQTKRVRTVGLHPAELQKARLGLDSKDEEIHSLRTNTSETLSKFTSCLSSHSNCILNNSSLASCFSGNSCHDFQTYNRATKSGQMSQMVMLVG